MKLRLKATKRDWMIFGAFAILLLVVVSILVNNINSFSTTGKFAGIDPFHALFHNLGAVLLFYIFAMIFLFVTVKDYFFDRDVGGPGISFGPKDEKGFSRWSTAKEVKNTLKEVNVRDSDYDYAGFPIISNGDKFWVDDADTHNIVIGSTGTGKTQCVIHPLVKILAKRGESMIVTDPKGEIYRESAGLLKEKGYQIIVLNFRDPQKGNTWNPLNLPYKLYQAGNTDKSMELLDDLAANILYDDTGGSSKDPFWEKTSADYFVGLALGLFEDAKEEEINLNSISLMTTVGEERFGGRSTYIKEYFNEKDPAGAAYTSASGTITAPEETKGSILSTFKQKIRLFASRENLSEMLSQNDFDIDSIGQKKTAVFMIIQDEKKTYHALATIFIKQVYESLIDVAQHSDKGQLPVRTNFILDEFQNMPPLKDITTMVAAARSRHIRLTMIVQNFAGLEATYNKEIAQTIRSNCTNLLYLLTTELSALKEISELCGDKMVKVGSGEKEREEARPLITVADLQKMKQFEAIVIRTRLNPYKTKLTPNFQIDWNIPKVDADPFVERQKRPVKVFDIKEFVKDKRKNKFMNMIENAGGMQDGGMAMPGMSGMPNMPGIPGMTTNPFNPIQNSNPMPGNPMSSSEPSGLNVDDLVKKIDAKIAELEKEEEEERKKIEEQKKKEEAAVKETKKKEEIQEVSEEKEVTETVSSSQEVANIAPTMFTGFKPSDEIAPMKKSEPVIDSPVSGIMVTDDQFFDDFFDE
ncbi:MAG: type IV secretory system conjugative DNA transfer family protein [Bacilli bacterium]|nr:type IV secretory system conjugative DNA transfer family protein [Bacilli bacterium]